MFGVCSARECYQKIIRDVIRECEGTASIADDIIVYGKDTQLNTVRVCLCYLFVYVKLC